ncbi:hypothetical protein Q7C36_008128 [Tachysurus vachellii]|uniref:Uncharacterized protein n=1 Tax=Tachysurus vachellii TaxID=175792 RepID=A0AA88N9L5_TACVA|nr:hypothetical protein Q7C36_008128 [Tachysurus vachellii]
MRVEELRGDLKEEQKRAEQRIRGLQYEKEETTAAICKGLEKRLQEQEEKIAKASERVKQEKRANPTMRDKRDEAKWKLLQDRRRKEANDSRADGITFGPFRNRLWDQLREAYPTKPDPGKVEKLKLDEEEGVAQFILKLQESWREEMGASWDETPASMTLFKLMLKRALPAEVQDQLETVVGLNTMPWATFEANVIHYTELQRKKKREAKKAEENLLVQLHKAQLGELMRNKQESHDKKKEDKEYTRQAAVMVASAAVQVAPPQDGGAPQVSSSMFTGIFSHFTLLTDVPILMKLREALDKNYNTILKFFQEVNYQGVKDVLTTFEPEASDKTAIILLLLMAYFNEPKDSIVLDVDPCATATDIERTVPSTPCLIVQGDKLKPRAWMLSLEGQVVMGSHPDFTTGLAGTFASYYNFNLKYADSGSCTLEFIQRRFLGINSETGTKSKKQKGLINQQVCTLIRKLIDFEWMSV